MESTGPTGPTGPEPTEFVPHFPNDGTGTAEPPHIVTLEELMASHAVVVAQETADRAALSPLTNPTRDAYRPRMFAWAAAGFPGAYVVQSFAMTPPPVCADGVVRNAIEYAWYLLGSDIAPLLANIQTLMTGVTASYSFAGNVLQIHVAKS